MTALALLAVAALLIWSAATSSPGLNVPAPVAYLVAGALVLGALRAIQQITKPGSAGNGLATLLLTSMAAVGLWIAAAPGVRVCAGGPGPGTMKPLSGLACRVPFGLGAVLTALLAGYAARQWWRGRRAAGRRATGDQD